MAFSSPAPKRNVEPQEIPIKIVGGCEFGRYNKINFSQTWNMIVSDGALVDYAGYKNLFPEPLVLNGKGRGIYKSSNADLIFVVIGSAFFSVNIINNNPVYSPHGSLTTSVGDVFMAENNNGQIAITDESHLYVYNYLTNTFQQSGLAGFVVPFTQPGYVSFQNGRLIVADMETQNWYLSGINDATQWDLNDVNNKAYVGSIQVKPDTIQAAVPIPGAGNNLAIFGHTVMELWQYTGAALFPYQRASTYNVDYGCLNASSIAALDSYIVWLSSNEQGGATLMVVNGAGGREESISTDGIDFLLANISDPTNCTGFLFRQDGHLIYQFTFPTDNISLAYDFDSKLFFYVSDENQNYHIARNVVYFKNDYYFVSLNDGNIYTFGTQFTNLQYSESNIKQMYRDRITPPIRLPNQRMFIAKSAGFTVENGQLNSEIQVYQSSFLITQDGNILIAQDGNYLQSQPDYVTLTGEFTEAIDLSISRDGAESFGNSVRNYMNPTGQRKSRMIFQRLGQANDMTLQIRLIGYGRFVLFDGIVEAYS